MGNTYLITKNSSPIESSEENKTKKIFLNRLLLKIKKSTIKNFFSSHKKQNKTLLSNNSFKNINKMAYTARYVNPRFTLENRVYIGK